MLITVWLHLFYLSVFSRGNDIRFSSTFEQLKAEVRLYLQPYRAANPKLTESAQNEVRISVHIYGLNVVQRGFSILAEAQNIGRKKLKMPV